MKFIKKLLRNTKGATAIEYGLLAALISVAAMTTMGTLGTTLNTTFSDIDAEMTV
jgi:pilus assembly protein Flp/PilA